MALMEEEQLILSWLSQYGPLPQAAIRRLLHYKSGQTVSRILRGLKRRRYIVEIEDGAYLATDRYCAPKRRMLTAVWVLIQFAQQIVPGAHHQGDNPSQIFFLKESTAYEIVVVYDGEEHLLRLLQPQEDTKYIIVVPDRSMVEKLPLPDAPCLFATVELADGTEPKITFYSI